MTGQKRQRLQQLKKVSDLVKLIITMNVVYVGLVTQKEYLTIRVKSILLLPDHLVDNVYKH